MASFEVSAETFRWDRALLTVHPFSGAGARISRQMPSFSTLAPVATGDTQPSQFAARSPTM
jgi:hypothetical protein